MPDSPAQDQVAELKRLAGAKFGELSEAEKRLVLAAPKGKLAVCGPNTDPDGPAYDPSKGEEWGPDREIRADLIRWLCVDPRAKEFVDPKGILVFGAKTKDPLDLSFVVVPFPLELGYCWLMNDLDLRGAEIPALNLPGSWVSSLLADGINVKGGVFLRAGFHCKGEVRFLGAQIGGNLECVGGTFENPARGEGNGIALSADRVVVKGSVLLRDSFGTEGEVRLLGAQIGGQLDCSCAKIGGTMLAQSAVIKVGLLWRGIDPKDTVLDLTNASADALGDEAESWPATGHLFLDGFVYGRISEGPTDARSRLAWLAREVPFKPQPYVQLAKVLRDGGDDDGAATVLVEMERQQRLSDGWAERPWDLLLRWTTGYGYRPLRALGGLAALTGVGWIIYRRALLAKTIAPTDPEAYEWYKDKGQRPAHYVEFSPVMYSVENSLPLVKLGQADYWQPDPKRIPILSEPLLRRVWRIVRTAFSPRFWGRVVRRCWRLAKSPQLFRRVFLRTTASPIFLQRFLWFQIILGWILATLFLAGVTGLIKR